MAPHSNTLAWRIPGMEEPGRLQSMGLWRVGHDWATSLSLYTFTLHFHALEKEMATHSSVLPWRIPGTGEPGGLPSVGSQSRTRLKRLSSSSRILIRILDGVASSEESKCELWATLPDDSCCCLARLIQPPQEGLPPGSIGPHTSFLHAQSCWIFSLKDLRWGGEGIQSWKWSLLLFQLYYGLN